MKYLHTIAGKPATYQQGEQIVYACRTTRITLASSLRQIRREQQASTAWRIKNGFKPHNHDYSHNLVRP